MKYVPNDWTWHILLTGLVAEMGRLATVPIDFSPQRPNSDA